MLGSLAHARLPAVKRSLLYNDDPTVFHALPIHYDIEGRSVRIGFDFLDNIGNLDTIPQAVNKRTFLMS